MASTLSASMEVKLKYSMTKTQTGAAPSQANGSPNSKAAVSSVTANNAIGGGDILYGPILRTLGTSANETLDLAGALTDLLGDAAVFARVKGIAIFLLSASQTAPDGTAGTACTSIKVGQATNAALAGSSGFIDGTTPAFRVFNGGHASFGVGNAAGVTIGAGTTDELKVTNEDGTNQAKYLIFIQGGSS